MTLITILANFLWLVLNLQNTELQAVHALVKGLPTYGSWISFTQITNTYISDWVHSEARKNPPDREAPNVLWESLVSRLTQECIHLSTTATKSLPISKNDSGSEYAGCCSHIIIQKSKQNPNGIKCTNCNGVSHNIDHCFSLKGGMAGLRQAF